MASAPSDPRPILGRVDAQGRLIAADPELEQLQIDAGSALGSCLALPQLAGIVRLARRLRIPISRRVLAAASEQDIDMWVRAVPDGDMVALTIDRWNARAASGPRLSSMASVEHEMLAVQPLGWSVDEQLRIVTMAPALADLLSLDAAATAGEPLTKLFRFEDNDEGEMPLMGALASRTGFSGQRVKSRAGDATFVLNGEAALGPDGRFAGFDGSADPLSADPGGLPADEPIVDSAIHSALTSPLDTIVRSAEDMIEVSGETMSANYAGYAADIATAARHLLSVIRSLGTEPDPPHADGVDLAVLVFEAVSLLDSAARDKEIAIGVERVDYLAARGESRSIIQILVNLIGNAIRYSPPRSAVTVSFGKAAGSILIHVVDQGAGIEADDQKRLFEPFQQGSEASEGAGLGLAIARRLARAMGGEVSLQSSPGIGSRFTLRLSAVPV